jgi:hypothetical protein
MNMNQTKTDYRRIIHATLNLDKPRTPALITFNEVYRGLQNDNIKNISTVLDTRNLSNERFAPFYTPDEKAKAHYSYDKARRDTLAEFLKRQYNQDNTRNNLRKIRFGYSRGDYKDHITHTAKKSGLEFAKIIRDANNPPDQVEQDRRQLDYTLRACEYIQRLESMRNDNIIRKLEPRLLEIEECFERGEWTYMYWNKLEIDTMVQARLNYLFKLHRTHASIKSPLQVAHYPTLKHLRDKREVVTKLGKYLTTFKDYLELSESDIKNIVEKHNAIIASQSGWTLNFIESTDADGFEKIYKNCLAGSCMKGMSAVRTYAHEKSVIRLAYLTNGANEIIARCLVREDRKQYIRTYPETNGSSEGRHLADILKANGYTHGNLEGCLLRAIPYEDDEDIYEAPYIDGGIDGNGSDGSAQQGKIVEIDGKEYIEISTDGYLHLTNTNGYTDDVEDEDMSECDDCGDIVSNDEMYSTYHDQYICEHCINNNYYYAYVRNGQDYVHADHVVTVGDNHYHVDYLDRYDIYACEASGDFYHIDDLVMTSMGYIAHEYSQALDHADDEGNDYAHENDARELSDGTWCHADNFEDLQKEIDEENADDEDEDNTQPTDDKQTTSGNIAQLTQGLLR